MHNISIMQKIPKKIHYCWFGKGKKPKLFKKCLDSWEKYCPGYEIIEWNEDNFPIQQFPYAQRAYDDGKWAFVSDVARIWALYHHGGIYLDTDMEIIKPIDAFCKHDMFLGMEDTNGTVNGAIIGCIPHHSFNEALLNTYHTLTEYTTIPVLITHQLQKQGYICKNQQQTIANIHIYTPEYFYPLPFTATFKKAMITKNTHTIHWWDYSWTPKLTQLLYKIGLLPLAVYIKHILTGKK